MQKSIILRPESAIKKNNLKTQIIAQSLSRLFLHIIFHVKITSVLLRKEDKDDLYSYMGSIIKDNDSIPILINGIEDHIHVLCVMSKNIALAKFVEEIKRHSSRWIKTKDSYYSNFAWQGGYGGFSVSPSLQDKTKNYIANQEVHYRKMSLERSICCF